MHLPNYDRLMREYLAYLQDIRGYSLATLTTYRIALTQLSSNYTIDDNRLDIKPFRLILVGQAAKTISKKLSAVRGFTKFLNAQKGYSFDLVGDYAIKIPKTLPKPIATSYIDEALSIASLQEKALIFLMYGVGLRISEVASIELKNISKEWLIVHGKGNKERQLPLLEIVSKTLEEHITFAKPKTYLFEKKGKTMSINQIRHATTKLFKSKGIKVTPHQLRHTFATELLNNDARLSDISKLLGHTTMASTQIYTQLASTKKLQDYLAAHPLCR
ncbi:MAG: integrase [Sulfurovum sp. PC08-66]|jgi:integrase/recombinase XerC|nr:MAG: integrase [Sulfurovum sp. PC08-66]